MTVAELIERLIACDLDAEVLVVECHYDGNSDIYDILPPAVFDHDHVVIISPDALYHKQFAS